MPAIHKGSPRIKFPLVASKRQSVLGGLPAIEALAQEFDLWRKLRRLSLLGPRKRKGRGFGPDAIVAQFIYGCAADGASLADAERLAADSLARRLAAWIVLPMKRPWAKGCGRKPRKGSTRSGS